MYNKNLKSFLAIADYGSINKAAETLYISPTACMKQINSLENELGVKLFKRTHHGLFLSDAGKIIYDDARYIIDYSNKSINYAKSVENNNALNIRIGISLMNQCTYIVQMLEKIYNKDSRFVFDIKPFNDTRDDFTGTISHLGEKVDIIPCIYGFTNWGKVFYNTIKLFDEPICIAASKNHKLNKKKNLKISDLNNTEIFITEPGDSDVLDKIRSELEDRKINIHFINSKCYDIELYNKVVSSDTLIFTTPTWVDLHPMLSVIDLNLKYTIPYGIIYSKEPSIAVSEFIKEIKLV